ncbi:MAG: DUF6489 family protein, partial [Alphaproteobacteria bacterium]|nr:DUF6489 family protein [Alphaproteobacteria bacterium]
MKITFNIDCTPEEARNLLGLPDLGPMQRALTEELEKKMKESMQLLNNPLTPQNWFNPGLQSLFWEQMQKTMQNITETAANNMLSFSH